ncbi:MarR family winged helix-turn-helix transcriptional regulator [Nocardioides yefusunii]|uniref:MarR family winged helix-turn-helix transcriptional regulator n=1 Tax=Nocardioides yefusunii TaxID=2500546 RepID=A0ABW1QZ42_9ACTN|nr:MarR family transcriptional regulator [Nocardioides yefusunii]
MSDLTSPGSSHHSVPCPSPSFALLLRRTEHVMTQHVAARIAPLLDTHDLTIERWRVVAALAAEPEQTMTQLAERAVLPPASLTRHVDRLVARGLVIRLASPEDRRRVVASLSEDGHRVWQQVDSTEREVHAQLAAAIGEQRFASLTADLAAVPELLTAW